MSVVSLDDSTCVLLDDGSRSRAYFCQKKNVCVNDGLIKELNTIAISLEDKNLRLCLHHAPEANFHDMIILERKGKYYRPHKHLSKGESWHVIEGEMGVVIFDEDGNVTDVCRLSLTGNFIFRVGEGVFHAVMPLTDFVIYHESKPGPFLGPEDSIFPDWAPDGSDEATTVAYVQELQTMLVKS